MDVADRRDPPHGRGRHRTLSALTTSIVLLLLGPRGRRPRPNGTGRAPTHAAAAAKRSNDYKPENGPRRPLSSICTGAGPRPSPTPSAAPERLGVNAADIRTRACAWPSVNGSAEGRRDASAIHASGRRDAASPRSSVSSRRLCGAHNSGIAGGHGHAVGATIATVAKRSRRGSQFGSRLHRSDRQWDTASPWKRSSVLTRARDRMQQCGPADGDDCVTPTPVTAPRGRSARRQR